MPMQIRQSFVHFRDGKQQFIYSHDLPDMSNKMMHKNFVLHYTLLKTIFKCMHADRKSTEVQKSIPNTK
jgi:hypothetical protein